VVDPLGFSTVRRKLDGDPTTAPAQAVLAVVVQVRDGRLQVLLWQRNRQPFSGAWALPGGTLGGGQTLEESIRRHLAAKVDVRELAHLEQLGSWSAIDRVPGRRELATAFLGILPAGVDPAVPEDTRWHAVEGLPRLAFDHREIVLAGRERLRGKLSYTNVGFALAPASFTLSELRGLYAAALGHDVSATNLKRVLLRRDVLEPTGARREPGRSGGRPAEVYRFRSRRLEITDPFATLRPPV
jgi:ADP-ribose pyrophosphatase YjhB (NUDIX family)